MVLYVDFINKIAEHINTLDVVIIDQFYFGYTIDNPFKKIEIKSFLINFTYQLINFDICCYVWLLNKMYNTIIAFIILPFAPHISFIIFLLIRFVMFELNKEFNLNLFDDNQNKIIHSNEICIELPVYENFYYSEIHEHIYKFFYITQEKEFKKNDNTLFLNSFTNNSNYTYNEIKKFTKFNLLT
jgi:hypothetical protein